MIIRPKLPPYQRSKSINKTPKRIKMIAQTLFKDLPSGTEILDNQVAGHTFELGTDKIGMLKTQNDGSVLKGAAKPICGKREIKFYEEINDLCDPSKAMLRKFIPEYRGTVQMTFHGKCIDFIKLADITHDMSEPCVMDIKIGKRTWDPLALSDKIIAEEQKYHACKQSLGFCIPGFQVYDIKTGRIKRFSKEYGKRLDQDTVKDALKIFLNASSQLSRTLLIKFLSTLWSIQRWARSQTTLRLYSSSLLLVYDAKRLKNHLFCNQSYSSGFIESPNGSLSRSSSTDSTIKSQLTPTSSSGSDCPAAIQHQEHLLNESNHCIEENGFHGDRDDSTFNSIGGTGTDSNNDSIQLYKQLQKCHSTQNNYEEDMKEIRKDYDLFLDNLIDGSERDESKEWAFVKMIDFAHVFPAESESNDINYLFGIESLIKIFDEFLHECDQ